MQPTTPQTAFPAARAMLSITAMAVGLLGVAWFLVPALCGKETSSYQAALFAAGLVWGTAMLGLLPLAIVGRAGVMPVVYAYFIGMAIRMPLCLLATIAAVNMGYLPSKPVFAALGVFYLPILLAEAGLVGSHLWRKDPAQGKTPGSAHGVEKPIQEIHA